jgi:hypothetical protein
MKLAHISASVVFGFLIGALCVHSLTDHKHEKAGPTPGQTPPGAHEKVGWTRGKLDPAIGQSPPNIPVPSGQRDNTADMLARQKAGYYVLDYEIASSREARAEDARRGGLANIEQKSLEYDDVFGALGVDGTTADQLKQHVAKIYQAHIEANQYVAQLATAQEAYSKRLRSLLGENYSVYVNYEQGQAARKEAERLGAFAAKSGVQLSHEERTQVETLLREAAAYSLLTKLSSSGPFQPLAPTAVGRENVLALFQANQAEYQASVERLFNLPGTKLLSEQTQQILRAYSSGVQEENQKKVERESTPEASRLYLLESQLAAMKKSPHPNAKLIKGIESAILQLREKKGP